MSLISKRLPFGGGVFWWGRKRLFGLRVILYLAFAFAARLAIAVDAGGCAYEEASGMTSGIPFFEGVLARIDG
jgi:hypothetical protein